MPARLDARQPGFAAAFARLLSVKRESAADVNAVVARIIADVRTRGDKALIAYTRRFDGFAATAGRLRVTEREIAAAVKRCDPTALRALKLAARRIEEDLSGTVHVFPCGDMATAVTTALQVASKGDILLLSPACASFDQFTDYEDRGRRFKALVAETAPTR